MIAFFPIVPAMMVSRAPRACVGVNPETRAISPRSVFAALATPGKSLGSRSEEHTSELQSLRHLVCRLLLEKNNQFSASHHDSRPHNRNGDLEPDYQLG